MRIRDVRFTPNSGHVQHRKGCPLCANSGHPDVASDKISAYKVALMRPSADASHLPRGSELLCADALEADESNVAGVSRSDFERLSSDLLHQSSSDGFNADWSKISEADAADFLRGIDGGLVKHEGRGLYRAPHSDASEQFFWSGGKQKTPRPITLWVEPIITVAVLARLHFELGWPKELLGTQIGKDWAFDAAAFLSRDTDVEYIACEVKKSTAEIGKLLERMNRFGKDPHAGRTRKDENAFRKVRALRCHRPPLFWAVGPGGSSHAFRVKYSEEGVISFHEIEIQKLDYLSAKRAGFQ